MANFPGLVLTQAGRNLQAKAQIGAALKFTRVALGDGSTNAPDEMSELDNELLSLSIQDFEVVGDGTSRMRVIMTNEALENGFFVRELGVFAEDPDTGEERLYSYTNAGNQPDFLPAGGGATLVENVFDLYTVVGNAQNVTAVISDYITIATKQDIDEIRPQLMPVGGLTHQLARKRSNSDGDVEWYDPAEGVNIAVESLEEPRVAVAGQRTFSLAIVSTRGMAAYVNGQRVPRSGWEPLGETQMRFNAELNDGDEVLFVRNEEVGELVLPRVSLDGPALIYPDSVNTYTITDYDGFAQYAVTTSRGTVSRTANTITITLDAAELDGALDLNITRDNAGVTYPLAVGAPTVATPELTGPINGATGVELSPTLQATTFSTYPGDYDTHATTDWQIASDAAFTAIVWESAADATNLTSIGVPAGVLDMTTQYYTRARYNGQSLGASAWSAVVAFETTDQYIATPSITAPAEGATNQPESPVLECSAFATDPTGSDTHFGTSWRVKDSQGTVVWENLNDSANKTGIAIPAGVLQESVTYTAEVRHIGESLPGSQWSAGVSFTTASQFVPTQSGTPFGGGYFVSRMLDAGGNEYALVVSTKAAGDPGSGRNWQDALNFVAALTSNGLSDWKLPDLDEARALYWEYKPTTFDNDTGFGASNRIIPPTTNYTIGSPSVTNVSAFLSGNSEALSVSEHWTEVPGSQSNVAYSSRHLDGRESVNDKVNPMQVRAVRRVYL
ncbi:hypothetical protein [Vreelandella neptunia]|uniref:hypothetical protein n=1 Tax=Vreelandella neptunia TaxID=115551 RepID=UPI00315B3B16